MEDLYINEPQESESDYITQTAQQHFGINYLFPFQRLVISNIMEAADFIAQAGSSTDASDTDLLADTPLKQIVILPTGAGKSLCFMLPAVLLDGPTLVIFPLLSLISDQLRRCDEAGIGAGRLTGGQSAPEREEVFSGIADGSIKLVLSNPETALSSQVLPQLKNAGFRHLVYDEVHTVSEWGDTFRPAYLECGRLADEAGIEIVTAFTATASETVLERVKEVLFAEENPHIVSADPDRPNISYTVLPSLSKINSLQMLLTRNGSAYSPAALVRRPALVFCASRKTARKTALQLRIRLNETQIFFYHAGLDKAEKAEVENWFFNSKDGILCATTAYGLGIDKPDIRTVIHYDLSPSVEAYLQESGRAGRDRSPAEALLLLSPADSALKNCRAESPDGIKRYSALLRFAADSSRCRRDSLMSLLGTAPEMCFGCDVCRKNVEERAPWVDEAVLFIKQNRRVFSQAGARKVLASRLGIKEDDAADIISELLTDGKLRMIRRGPWKGKLTISALKNRH